MASRPGGGDAAIALAEFVNRPQSVWVKSAICLTAVLHFPLLRCVVSTNKKTALACLSQSGLYLFSFRFSQIFRAPAS
jgi:hypothetical protein